MFDRQLAQTYYKQGTCCELRRISTVRQYSHETPTNQSVLGLAQPRMEFRVIDLVADVAAQACGAIRDWLSTVDFSSNDQFGSPPVAAKRHPNFVLNEVDGFIPATNPPIPVQILDVRIFDLE